MDKMAQVDATTADSLRCTRDEAFKGGRVCTWGESWSAVCDESEHDSAVRRRMCHLAQNVPRQWERWVDSLVRECDLCAAGSCMIP